MPCPTCDHTLQNIGAKDQRIFWCPRCGTLVYEADNFRGENCPYLANYVRNWWANNGQHFDPTEYKLPVGMPWMMAILECVGIKSDRKTKEE